MQETNNEWKSRREMILAPVSMSTLDQTGRSFCVRDWERDGRRSISKYKSLCHHSGK